MQHVGNSDMLFFLYDGSPAGVGDEGRLASLQGL